MNPTPRKMSNEDNELIKQFLNDGGEIQKIKAGERSEEIDFKGGFYQRRKKKKEEEQNGSK